MIEPGRRTLLRAGPLRLALVDGRVQWVTVGEVEVVRRIYVALRDESWTTVPFMIERSDADVRERAFDVSYSATATSPSGTFAFTLEIRGRAEGALEVALHGEARTQLTTNRVGLCLHYPHELAGSALRAWRTDDPTERSAAFPSAVEPDPPLLGLGGILHPAGGSTWCRASFHGDVFEMEDQRNFGDASFKVYSTPSADPVPRVLQPGDRVEQRIVVELVDAPAGAEAAGGGSRTQRFLGAATLDRAAHGASAPEIAPAASSPTHADPVVVEVSEEAAGYVPALGTDITRLCTAEGTPASRPGRERAATDLLATLGVSTARLELDLADPRWSQACQRGLDLAGPARLRLDLVLTGDEESRTENAFAWLARHAERIATICVTGPLGDPDALSARVRRLRRVLREAGAVVPIGAGTAGWLIEVNGAALPLDDIDFVAYALTPQVHAFDDDALRENLAAIEPQLATARSLAQGCEVRVGPVTLRPRGSEAGASETLWPTPRDPRLDHPLGAIWTLGAIARHAVGGASALALFEVEGPEALDAPAEAEPPARAPAIGDVIRELAPLAGREAFLSGSTSPLDAFALAVRTAGGGVCWLANPTERPVQVELRLPATTEAARRRLRLGPYDLRRISWDGGVSP